MLNGAKIRTQALSEIMEKVMKYNEELDKAYKKSVETHDYAEGLELLGMQKALTKVMFFIMESNESMKIEKAVIDL